LSRIIALEGHERLSYCLTTEPWAVLIKKWEEV
jgi:hypothetical protein